MDARLQRLQALVTNNKGGRSDSTLLRHDNAGSSDTKGPRRGRERIQPQVIFKAERPRDKKPAQEHDAGLAVDAPAASKTMAQPDAEMRKRMKELALEKHKQREAEDRQRRLEAEREPTKASQSEIKPNLARVEKEQTEEEEEEDEGQTTPLLRPVFVPKTHRHEDVSTSGKDEQGEREREAQRLLIEYVRREYEASLPQENDDSQTVNDPLSIDDTDPTDEIGQETELQAWKLRELLRIKRDRAAREHWEREQMELERVRNMTEEERRRLDEEKMREWQERPQSQMRFMQKYYHKGAFFMDEQEPLYQRDYAQATGEDAHANKEMLPEVKQVRDFGKKGRSKWTHLVGEDTTAFDYGWGRRKNEANYKLISRMGGMRGHLDNPSKRPRNG